MLSHPFVVLVCEITNLCWSTIKFRSNTEVKVVKKWWNSPKNETQTIHLDLKTKMFIRSFGSFRKSQSNRKLSDQTLINKLLIVISVLFALNVIYRDVVSAWHRVLTRYSNILVFGEFFFFFAIFWRSKICRIVLRYFSVLNASLHPISPLSWMCYFNWLSDYDSLIWRDFRVKCNFDGRLSTWFYKQVQPHIWKLVQWKCLFAI